MEKTFAWPALLCFCISGFAFADLFGDGNGQFEIEFVEISGNTNPAEGYGIVPYDYRIGRFEVTNAQWDGFAAAVGTVTGFPPLAYDEGAVWTDPNVPTNMVSWYEAAQFVNWLNTSTGRPAAYQFTGTPGTEDYEFTVWDANDVGYDPSNPYRNSRAFYFLPSEDEWVKAAYWNGAALQTWATPGGAAPTQPGWNFYDGDYVTDPPGPWVVGSGDAELNGSFDMMGNVWELLESPYTPGLYESARVVRGGAYNYQDNHLRSFNRSYLGPALEHDNFGFRVAAAPCAAVDLTGDCATDLADFAVLARAWLSMDGEPNYNGLCDLSVPADQRIDAADLAVLAEHWLEGK